MEIRNRLTDVNVLRCKACQDYLKFRLIDGWQQALYDTAKERMKGKYRSSYKSIFERMRDCGTACFRVEDMDVTAIATIINYCPKIAPSKQKTKDAFEEVHIDRNTDCHLNGNEDDEALYLQGLLDLCSLKRFVVAVDQNETDISDAIRQEYRQKYYKEIQELKEVLDDERIKLIYKWKQIESDVQRILDSNDRLRSWIKVYEKYDKMRELGQRQEYYDFLIRASDAGIVEAHQFAVNYELYKKRSISHIEKRMMMWFDSLNTSDAFYTLRFIQGFIDFANTVVQKEHHQTETIKYIVEKLNEHGYTLEQAPDGFFLPFKNKASRSST